MTTDRTVLIVGTQGRFGRVAAEAFAAAGWRVLGLGRRQGPSADRRADNVQWLSGALTDTAALALQAGGARVLVHAANPAYTRWETDALPMARACMALAQRLEASFMLPGNVYGFGEDMPARLGEATPQRPSTRKGRVRMAMEAELGERAAQGLSSVVIRAGDFFGGAGRGTWFDLAIAKSLRAGRLFYPGPLDVPHAWAYLPDLARAFVAVAALPRPQVPSAQRFHFAGHTLTGAQLLDAIEAVAEAAGIHPARGWRRGAMPWPLIRAGGLLVPAWREVAEMAYLWRVPHALDGSALRGAVGALPATPLDEALRAGLSALHLISA